MGMRRAKRRKVARQSVTCTLLLALLALSLAPVKTLYHCRITGETHTGDCCNEKAQCGSPASACGSDSCAQEPSGEVAPCSCCETTYERQELAAAVKPSEDNEKESCWLAQRRSGCRFASPRLSGVAARVPKESRASSSVYLLHCSLVI
jgi:hypothetical protein